ncbi:MAG TPA: transporter substrate-binding domain-containing protein [Bordetella sp.]
MKSKPQHLLFRFLAGMTLATASHLAMAGVLEDAKARGELVACTEFQFAPFEFLDGDKPVGFDIDLVALIAQDMGVKVKYIDLPWSSVLPALESKRCDLVLAGVMRTKARMERYDMSLPIGDAIVALVKRHGDASIMKPEDIAGKVVGGVKGSAQIQIFQNFIDTKVPGGVKELKAYTASTQSYADLAAGRIVVASAAMANLAYLVKTRPEFEIVEPGFGPPTYFGFPIRKEPESQTLAAAINAGITKYNKDGTMAKLQEKWFGKAFTLPYENVPEPTI